jgi:pimeloyl-ACP methyl ester carboxylesterase
VIDAAHDQWRVIAPDHLGMGNSERVEEHLTLRDRIDELSAPTDALHLQGPVVIVAHDWGGSIGLGWAEQRLDMVAGVMLLNTAVSQPHGERAPALIRLARSTPLRETVTSRTDLFVRATLRQARPPLPADVTAAYSAPYRSAGRRQAIADFVADIPLEPIHRSHNTLTAVAAGLDQMRSIPVLLAWGTRDPVFTEPYLRDLQRRLPQAVTHRFENAGHLVIEDAPIARLVTQFAADSIKTASNEADDNRSATEQTRTPVSLASSRRPLWAALHAHADDDTTAIVEMGRTAPNREISWRQLAATVDQLAKGMNAVGIEPGDRVALLVPPGADLTAILYATWRAGATAVVADAGLGLAGLRRALRGADVKHVFGEAKGLSAARAMGLRATFISVGAIPRPARAVLGIDYGLAELREIGKERPTIAEPAAGDVAAVLFTSGATGPAKGVVYRHLQLEAQRDAVRTAFAVGAAGVPRLISRTAVRAGEPWR